MSTGVLLVISSIVLTLIAAQLMPLVIGIVGGYYSVKTIKKVV